GHISNTMLELLVKNKSVEGLTIDPESRSKAEDCEACIQAEMHWRPFLHKALHRSENPGEGVHSDLWGPAHTRSTKGNCYYLGCGATAVSSRNFVLMSFLCSMFAVPNNHFLSAPVTRPVVFGVRVQQACNSNGPLFIYITIERFVSRQTSKWSQEPWIPRVGCRGSNSDVKSQPNNYHPEHSYLDRLLVSTTRSTAPTVLHPNPCN
ncbi:hypothetical protein C8R44DRAFT_644627, partial [Mycena epipterygia]